MTEEQWLETNTARVMVEYLTGQASERKLRLFACAACRRIWRVMQYEASHKAVEVSERFADGQAKRHELLRVVGAAEILADTAERDNLRGWHAARTAARAAAEDARTAALRAAEVAADAELLREHFGNPFRPFTLSRDVLSWQDKTIVRLAQAAYDDRSLPSGTLDNTRLAILADALDEAGCADEQILTHLRGGGAHYRGCFVVDALLSKS
jgi:hypothetical protein